LAVLFALGLRPGVRPALGVEVQEQARDRLSPAHRVGLIDVVSWPTAEASELGREELAAGTAAYLAKLGRYQRPVARLGGMIEIGRLRR
jgi:hypothetical protein